MGIGRTFFLGAVSPSIMSAAAAASLFDEVTSLLASTIAALALVAVLVAVWAWLAGTSRPAVRARTLFEDGFAAMRGAAERRGVTTGRFGAGVDRYRGPILVAGLVLALLLLIVTRPVTFGAVIGVTVGLLMLVVLVELLRRPPEIEGDEAIAAEEALADDDGPLTEGTVAPGEAATPAEEITPRG
ncbi:hypothetical protein [Microbacterium sp. p3-SID336]|uniref:hypothetical protein n=1 Tax=Microbacterium sp. p3-SID336 TaxID=2916212 RepID=UPI0021A5A716|nr:hypothetical protein [Microbacterium sp. p3-SID336]MCT1479221.1 hypothetical protein [Microbacterium sp. p3-SID336]